MDQPSNSHRKFDPESRLRQSQASGSGQPDIGDSQRKTPPWMQGRTWDFANKTEAVERARRLYDFFSSAPPSSNESLSRKQAVLLAEDVAFFRDAQFEHNPAHGAPVHSPEEDPPQMEMWKALWTSIRQQWSKAPARLMQWRKWLTTQINEPEFRDVAFMALLALDEAYGQVVAIPSVMQGRLKMDVYFRSLFSGGYTFYALPKKLRSGALEVISRAIGDFDCCALAVSLARTLRPLPIELLDQLITNAYEILATPACSTFLAKSPTSYLISLVKSPNILPDDTSNLGIPFWMSTRDREFLYDPYIDLADLCGRLIFSLPESESQRNYIRQLVGWIFSSDPLRRFFARTACMAHFLADSSIGLLMRLHEFGPVAEVARSYFAMLRTQAESAIDVKAIFSPSHSRRDGHALWDADAHICRLKWLFLREYLRAEATAVGKAMCIYRLEQGAQLPNFDNTLVDQNLWQDCTSSSRFVSTAVNSLRAALQQSVIRTASGYKFAPESGSVTSLAAVEWLRQLLLPDATNFVANARHRIISDPEDLWQEFLLHMSRPERMRYLIAASQDARSLAYVRSAWVRFCIDTLQKPSWRRVRVSHEEHRHAVLSLPLLERDAHSAHDHKHLRTVEDVEQSQLCWESLTSEELAMVWWRIMAGISFRRIGGFFGVTAEAARSPLRKLKRHSHERLQD